MHDPDGTAVAGRDQAAQGLSARDVGRDLGVDGVRVTGKAADVDGVWKSVYAPLDAWAGQAIRIHFMAVDGASDSLVEVEIDDVRVTRGS